jgi:hypothetical protein
MEFIENAIIVASIGVFSQGINIKNGIVIEKCHPLGGKMRKR